MKTVTITCPKCGKQIEYDGSIKRCYLCRREFKSDDIKVWRDMLNNASCPSDKSDAFNLSSSPTTNDAVAEQVEADGFDGLGIVFADVNQVGEQQSQQSVTTEPFACTLVSDKRPTVSEKEQEVVYEFRGERFYNGLNACRFILQHGLVGEVLDRNDEITPSFSKMLSNINVDVYPVAYSRIGKFYEIMYCYVFDGESFPLYIGGNIQANNQRELIVKLLQNRFNTFNIEGKQYSLAQIAQEGVLKYYLRLDDNSKETLQRKCLEVGKRAYVDGQYRLYDLGTDVDIAKLDDKTAFRYDYYIDNDSEFPPCEGFTNGNLDSQFLSKFNSYDKRGEGKTFFNKYFYLLSVCFNVTGECNAFGLRFIKSSLAANAQKIVENAASRGDISQFLILRNLLHFNVFGRQSNDILKRIVEGTDVSEALFNAYYAIGKRESDLLYSSGDGGFVTADELADKVIDKGSVGSLFDDDKFKESVRKTCGVDVKRITSEIDEGITKILNQK